MPFQVLDSATCRFQVNSQSAHPNILGSLENYELAYSIKKQKKTDSTLTIHTKCFILSG